MIFHDQKSMLYLLSALFCDISIHYSKSPRIRNYKNKNLQAVSHVVCALKL